MKSNEQIAAEILDKEIAAIQNRSIVLHSEMMKSQTLVEKSIKQALSKRLNAFKAELVNDYYLIIDNACN